MIRVETETEKIVAVLHDVVENSQPPQRWGFDELRREGSSEPVLAAVECVTRREGEIYEEFIRRSLTHPVARRVKLADIKDNLDIRRLATLTDRDAERRRRRIIASAQPERIVERFDAGEVSARPRRRRTRCSSGRRGP